MEEEVRGEPPEFIVRFSKRELSKVLYLTRKHRRTQEKRRRRGDVLLLEDIEEKVNRALLGI